MFHHKLFEEWLWLKFTCSMSLNELQRWGWDGALLVELSEEQLLDVTSRVRDALLFVAVAVGFSVEELGVDPEERHHVFEDQSSKCSTQCEFHTGSLLREGYGCYAVEHLRFFEIVEFLYLHRSCHWDDVWCVDLYQTYFVNWKRHASKKTPEEENKQTTDLSI